MKTATLLFATILTTMTAFSQNVVNPYPKTITTNGSAEMEITPDEIYVQVDMKEYEKKPGGKVTIDKIRQNFLTAVRSLGLPDSNLVVSGYDGYNGNPWYRKKNKLKDELYASITYQVKLRSTAQVDQLVDKLDDAATQNFYISRTAHSKLAEMKKQLKIQAVQNAKEKATYLAEAVDEKLGVALTISEPGEYYQPYYGGAMASRMKTQAMDEAAPEQPQADFKKMKLRYDVNVVFALK